MLWGAKGIGLASSQRPGLRRLDEAARPTRSSDPPSGASPRPRTPDGKTFFYGSADPSNIWKKDGRYYMLTGNLLVLNKIGREPDAPLAEQGDRLYLLRLGRSEEPGNTCTSSTSGIRSGPTAARTTCVPASCRCRRVPTAGPPSGKHLLLFISHNKGCQYYVGDDTANDRFLPDNHGRMTWVGQHVLRPGGADRRPGAADHVGVADRQSGRREGEGLVGRLRPARARSGSARMAPCGCGR